MLDASTVQIKLKAPLTPFLQYLAHQSLFVYSPEARRKQENFSVWGCLKSRGVRVRLDVHRHYRLDVHPPAGRFVAVQTQKECENSIDCIDPWWLTLADLKTGQIYDVDQDYVGPTFLTWARVRPTGSVVFQVSLGSAQSRLVTCEMPQCYNGTRATRRVVLDEGRIKRPSLTGSTVRWRNNGTWRTAQLR